MGFLRDWQRRRLCRQPFPAAWQAILAGNVRQFERLSPEDRAELRGRITSYNVCYTKLLRPPPPV